jgi:hypothetical protein
VNISKETPFEKILASQNPQFANIELEKFESS